MKVLVILPLVLCVVQADSSDKQDVKTKTASPSLNTIPQTQKYELYYQPTVKYQQPVQPVLQPAQHFSQLQQIAHKYVPVQIVPRQYYIPQTQPHAIIIMAQPALVPQSFVYGNPTQQLLNYFHNNPQAKYQLLYGNQQQHQQQQSQQQQQQQQQQQAQPQPVQPTPTIMHHVVAAPTIGSYILTPAPHLQQIAAQPLTAHRFVTQPIATHHIATQPIAAHQIAAQAVTVQQQPTTTHHASSQASSNQPTAPGAQYASQQSAQQPSPLSNIAQLAQLAAQQYVSSQLKTAPAIVTGFEHFTPEQQAQIKAQLASHLGTNFHAVTGPVNTGNQYSAKYVAQQQASNDFVPSPQIKNEDQVTTVSSTDILKSRYVKSKNQ